MNTKNILYTATAIVLLAVYVVCFTDWFRTKTVQIFHTSRSLHPRYVREGAPKVTPPILIFGINVPVKLKEIKVVGADDFKTNQNALPLWHLVSDSNSIPMKEFTYGQFIRGMHAAVKGARPETLETNVTYHLIVLGARGVKGEHDFEVQ